MKLLRKSWVNRLKKVFKVQPKAQIARLHLYALPARHGDALLVQYVGPDNRNHYIWVDGGLAETYEQTGKAVLQAIDARDDLVDLLVVTHVDRDHIGGVLALALDSEAPHERIHRYWFNASRNLSQFYQTRHHPDKEVGGNAMGVRGIQEGMRLESFLQKEGKWDQQPIAQFQVESLSGMDVIVLGPEKEALAHLAQRWEDEMEDMSERNIADTRRIDQPASLEALAQKSFDEDDSRVNASSIVLALEFEGKRILLLGDAHPSATEDALKRLGYTPENPMVLDACKLSHHGSKRSLSTSFLDLIDCAHFIISTDGSRFDHPHRETLARIALHKRNQDRGTAFYFNYDNPELRSLLSADEMKAHKITCVFPDNPAMGAVLSWA